VSELLTAEEISALFDAFREPVAPESQPPRTRRKYLSREDAKRNRSSFQIESLTAALSLSNSQHAALQSLYQSFATVADDKLRRFLGEDVSARFLTLDERPYCDYCRASKHNVHALVLAQPMKGPFAIGFGFELAHAAIDTLLGRIPGQATRKQLNEVEKRLVLQTVERAVEAFNEVWEPISKLAAVVGKIETRSSQFQIALADDLVTIATMELTIGDFRGEMQVCMPNQVIKPFLAELAERAPKNFGASEIQPEFVPATLDVQLEVSDGGGSLRLSRHVEIAFLDGTRLYGEIAITPHGLAILTSEQAQKRAA